MLPAPVCPHMSSSFEECLCPEEAEASSAGVLVAMLALQAGLCLSDAGLEHQGLLTPALTTLVH